MGRLGLLIFNIGGPAVLLFLTGRLLFKVYRKKRNPLEWSTVDRCLLLYLISLTGYFASALIVEIVIIYYTHLPWPNWNLVPSTFETRLAFPTFITILMASFLIAGLWLRSRDPENRIFGHIYLQINAILMATGCYFTGALTHPGPFLSSMSIGVIVFLFFDLFLSLPWMITFIILNLGFAIGSWLELIPYAPMFASAPFNNGKIETAYLFGTIAFVIPFFIIILSFIAYIIVSWRKRESKLKQMTSFLKNVFGRYLSPEVMNTIIEKPDSIKLGGEKREITMMMTDLRGFTQLSERLNPEKVMTLLNRYFEVMMGICTKHHGTINDIFGDALLVTFGAPKEIKDHTLAAIACAIDMQNAMRLVNQENIREGLPELEMGIGINTAEVVVGNIGSEERAKFGVVGSGVNLTSRIESYAVGGQILISKSAYTLSNEFLRVDGQRDVLPKGTERPLRIYEVGGIAGNYNLSLEDKDITPVTLIKQIPLQCTVLEGKDMGGKDLQGFITKLSKKAAEIDFDRPVELFANLKMNLQDVDEKISSKDFYGKIVHSSKTNQKIYMVRFTSIPPEVEGYTP